MDQFSILFEPPIAKIQYVYILLTFEERHLMHNFNVSNILFQNICINDQILIQNDNLLS